MVAKADDNLIEVVRRALRNASAEDRTRVMELLFGEMVDHADWGSLMFWEGELENAVTEIFADAEPNRANRLWTLLQQSWERTSRKVERADRG